MKRAISLDGDLASPVATPRRFAWSDGRQLSAHMPASGELCADCGRMFTNHAWPGYECPPIALPKFDNLAGWPGHPAQNPTDPLVMGIEQYRAQHMLAPPVEHPWVAPKLEVLADAAVRAFPRFAGEYWQCMPESNLVLTPRYADLYATLTVDLQQYANRRQVVSALGAAGRSLAATLAHQIDLWRAGTRGLYTTVSDGRPGSVVRATPDHLPVRVDAAGASHGGLICTARVQVGGELPTTLGERAQWEWR